MRSREDTPSRSGGAPDDVAGKFVRALVKVSHFPHHSNDPATGEMIEIGRASLGRGGSIDQGGGGAIVETEARPENGVKLSAHCLRHFALDGRHADQQRRAADRR
jgi:hypothetical protein